MLGDTETLLIKGIGLILGSVRYRFGRI